ncbi:MAG: hypothetical protein QOH76_1466 [Thermoleophilaceae bacterium]|jgi:hypothetical protein|nr:hypothetical protein [Thermoleophilaceae bacterium]
MADGPAMRGDGVLEWRDDKGRLHRDGGPAASYPDGRRLWFQHGEKVREERVA